MLKAIALSLACLAVVASENQVARASDFTQYETFAVRNTTNGAIHYEVRWGNKAWKTFTLNPGATRWHYYPDDQGGPIPEPRLRFQTGGNRDNPIVITHVMSTEIVDQPRSVKPHVFRVNGSGQIQLHFVAPSQRQNPSPLPELRIDE